MFLDRVKSLYGSDSFIDSVRITCIFSAAKIPVFYFHVLLKNTMETLRTM